MRSHRWGDSVRMRGATELFADSGFPLERVTRRLRAGVSGYSGCALKSLIVAQSSRTAASLAR